MKASQLAGGDADEQKEHSSAEHLLSGREKR